MVRLVDSQWLEDATLESELVKVTSQDTALVASTVKVVLLVASVLSAADVAFVSVFWYSCPLTAPPEPSTVIVTTVHPLQVIDDAMPETEHDFSVDLIVTPDEVIECEPPRRPTGLYWNNLTTAKIAAIPVLAARAAAMRA